ncbi:MAG: hypothetical protein LBG12_03500 [Synergistaceae bacterium]|jgi:hypothetical protein|nr:hypothetical protein [Synergistaceae bacterium]
MPRFSAYLSGSFPERLKSRLPGKYTVAAFLLLVLTAAVLIHSLETGRIASPETSLLEMLPGNAPGIPTAVISTFKGEFPEDLARLLSCGRAVSSPVMSFFAPVLDDADAMAMVVAFRENGPAIYGVFTPSLEEYDALRLGTLPDGWKKRFASPKFRPAGRNGLFQLTAEDISSPIYIVAEDGVSFAADSLHDIDRIMDVRNGVAAGIKRKWSIAAERGGHAFFSDGGVLRSWMTGANAPNPKEALELEAAWVTSPDIRATSTDWRLWGADHFIPKNFLDGLQKDDWSGTDVFMPDPLILSFGITLPDPGRSMSNMPSPLQYLVDQLKRMGLRNSEIRALMTGRTAFSIGARAQVLWLDLPGLTLDISGRGEVSYKMIEKFWKWQFLDVEPKPVEGFEHGGFTDIPYTALAAANAERALLGLVEQPDAEQNYEAREMLSSVTDAAAWIYLDFPLLGASLADIPALNSTFSVDEDPSPDEESVPYEDDEDTPFDEESANNLKNAMAALGRVFITFESAAAGSAICHY